MYLVNPIMHACVDIAIASYTYELNPILTNLHGGLNQRLQCSYVASVLYGGPKGRAMR